MTGHCIVLHRAQGPRMLAKVSHKSVLGQAYTNFPWPFNLWEVYAALHFKKARLLWEDGLGG